MTDEANRPLRVLIFSPDPSLGGGVVEFADILARRLSPAIEAAWVFTGRRPGALGKALRLVMPITDALRLAVRLMRERHDIYHLNPSLVPRSLIRDGLFLFTLRMFGRRQVMVFFRGWDAKYFNRIAASRVGRFLFLRVYGHASRVLVLGSQFAIDLKALGFPADRVHTHTTMFDGDLLGDAKRSRDDTGVWILFLARFVADKGIYELLEAFRRISLGDAQARLIMAGDGQEAERARAWCVRHRLQDRVHFPGYVEGPEKATLLLNSDIFVLPSYHAEGCPNALLEAMGAGLPAIATAVGGIPDIVRDGLNGFIVPGPDVDALVAALRTLMQDPNLRQAMAQYNREVAWEKYEAKAVTALLEAHYQSMGGGSR